MGMYQQNGTWETSVLPCHSIREAPEEDERDYHTYGSEGRTEGTHHVPYNPPSTIPLFFLPYSQYTVPKYQQTGLDFGNTTTTSLPQCHRQGERRRE